MEYRFEDMPDHARLWIYQSDRPFTETEIPDLNQAIRQFIENWAAHGHPLKAAFRVEHHQFILIAVDETFHAPSGCSIDASVGLIRKIEETFNVSLLDRSKVAFWQEGNVVLYPMKDLKELIAAGNLDEQTPHFNNVIQYAGDLKKQWKVPAGQTWLNRYFA